MTETPDMPTLARCPDCKGYYDADDMTSGRCPNCAGPPPVDPWEGMAAQYADAALTLQVERDQARRFAAAWQGEAEAYRQVVEALTHEFSPRLSDTFCAQDISHLGWGQDRGTMCFQPPDHPVHRTIAVTQAELWPDDTSTPGVPASTGEQQR